MSSAAEDKKTQTFARSPVIDFDKYIDKEVRIKFVGGRECTGILKGWDHLVNLVLDEAVEHLCSFDTGMPTGETRKLGLMVCRSPSVMAISPCDGSQEIDNPFVTNDE